LQQIPGETSILLVGNERDAFQGRATQTPSLILPLRFKGKREREGKALFLQIRKLP
jgi:hypothetical protein